MIILITGISGAVLLTSFLVFIKIKRIKCPEYDLKKPLHILPCLTEVKRDAVQRNLDCPNQEQAVDK